MTRSAGLKVFKGLPEISPKVSENFRDFSPTPADFPRRQVAPLFAEVRA